MAIFLSFATHSLLGNITDIFAIANVHFSDVYSIPTPTNSNVQRRNLSLTPNFYKTVGLNLCHNSTILPKLWYQDSNQLAPNPS